MAQDARTWVARGFAWDAQSRDWTLPVEYVARDRMEAARWCNFQRDWCKRLTIEERTN
jgi:hypothetical protein